MDSDDSRWSLDEIAQGLATLRRDAGDISFADIAAQITHNRVVAGMPHKLAQVSRSTVYHAFQTGRSRINARLVADIVAVLTGDQDQAKVWLARCVTAQQPRSTPVSTAPMASQNPTTIPASDLANQMTAPPVNNDVGQPARLNGIGYKQPKPLIRNGRSVPAIVALGVLINAGLFLALHLPFPETFPLFADMAGVAIVALIAGPWWGGLTALLSAGTITAMSPLTGVGAHTIYFAPVAIAGALVWGYGLQRFKLGASLSRFLLLNVIVGVICTAVAYLVVGIAFGGTPMMNTVALMAASLTNHGLPQNIAVLISNFIISIIDKLIIGIFALMITGTALRKYAPAMIVSLVDRGADTPRRFHFTKLWQHLITIVLAG